MNDEDYFKSLMCKKCKQHYADESGICRHCKRKIKHQNIKNEMDDIMRQKQEPSIKFVLPKK